MADARRILWLMVALSGMFGCFVGLTWVVFSLFWDFDGNAYRFSTRLLPAAIGLAILCASATVVLLAFRRWRMER